MKVSSFFKTASLLSSLLTAPVLGQVGAPYTHPKTGIKFWKTTVTGGTTGGYEWGWALPGAPTGANDEYIGILVGSRVAGAGWSGLSHGYRMSNALLLVAWVDGTIVRTDFRYAPGYVTPDPYTGVANLTKISETVNSTHFELLYRCQGCWVWNQNGEAGSQLPTGEVTVVGWAQDNRNPVPLNRNDAAILQHNNGFGQFGNPPQSARNAAYTDWVKLAQPPATTTSATATATATATAAPCTATAPAGTFDYIVIGSGAGGIPVADKLSESGKSVLLIEKGPPSSGRWGGSNKVFPNWQPKWLEGTNLTRFDVPGLCNQLWVDSANIACDGISEMAGCVLGGGTAVNAALWWKPNPSDWDTVFPNGWKSSDMKSPAERVFKRIPGTDHPSKDGKLYLQQGYDVISSALAASGWKNVVANNVPEQKNQVYAHTPYMFANAERDGPMATYLVSASKRNNFKLWTNTQVKRVIRSGGHVTGVELEAFGKGGYCGTVNVTPNTGRVVLSAGVFGTSKILMRSGIGPQDQLTVVNGSKDAGSMIKEADWIKLPVGYNLVDHVNTDVVVHHPNVTFYDFYKAWTDPIPADIDAYLKKRTGILTQAAPNIGPLFWEQIKGSDGITRQLQWTARVEQSLDVNDTTAMTLSQYLGTGSTSRGRLTISGALNVGVTTVPYLQSQGDIDAVVQGVANIQKILGKIPTIVFDKPAPGQSAKDYVAAYRVATSNRRSNHWAGTAKMGTDSGEFSSGTSVVDLNTRVYGTDNLFVVDASIFPGMISTNPSSYIVTVAERAAERIIASPALSAIAKYGQCGGRSHTGARFCASGTTCQFQNPDYSQCL